MQVHPESYNVRFLIQTYIQQIANSNKDEHATKQSTMAWQ